MGTVPPLMTDQGDPDEREQARLEHLLALRHQGQQEQVERQGFRVGGRVKLLAAEPIPPAGRSALADDAVQASMDEQQRQLTALIGHTGEIVEVVQLDGKPQIVRVSFAAQLVHVDTWADCMQPVPPDGAEHADQPSGLG